MSHTRNIKFYRGTKQTRFRDVNNEVIYVGDRIHVQEVSNDEPIEKWQGTLDFIGIVEEGIDGKIYVGGENIHCFPKKLRNIIHNEQEYEEWDY